MLLQRIVQSDRMASLIAFGSYPTHSPQNHDCNLESFSKNSINTFFSSPRLTKGLALALSSSCLPAHINKFVLSTVVAGKCKKADLCAAILHWLSLLDEAASGCCEVSARKITSHDESKLCNSAFPAVRGKVSLCLTLSPDVNVLPC